MTDEKILNIPCKLCGKKLRHHRGNAFCVDRSKAYTIAQELEAKRQGFDIHLWGPDGPPPPIVGGGR